MHLDGRVALVTGASGALGAEFARVLSGSGARVVLAARRVEPMQALAQDLGQAHAVALDVTDPDGVRAARPDPGFSLASTRALGFTPGRDGWSS